MIDVKYKKIYDEFINHYKNVHINPWHEINEEKLNIIYENLINSMDVKDEYTFKYFIDYIIKRLSGISDAHTKYSTVSLIPMNFKIFNDNVLINFPDYLRGSQLKTINGINIETIINELEDVITYGTDGKRKYELEQSLFNKIILFGLPSLRNSEELHFEIETLEGVTITKIFKKHEKYSDDEMFDYEKYQFGTNATYKYIDDCLIYNHSSVQNKYKEKIENAINNLKNENLSKINKIIIDIRGNWGGNSALNKILINFLEEHKDKELITLTDYRVFSGGRYALRDLINLGAVTIGEEISTPINCYGNSNWINIDNHYFSVSEHYYHPMYGISFQTKEEYQNKITEKLLLPYIFKPDICIKPTKEDFINENDAILETAIQYHKSRIL